MTKLLYTAVNNINAKEPARCRRMLVLIELVSGTQCNLLLILNDVCYQRLFYQCKLALNTKGFSSNEHDDQRNLVENEPGMDGVLTVLHKQLCALCPNTSLSFCSKSPISTTQLHGITHEAASRLVTYSMKWQRPVSPGLPPSPSVSPPASTAETASSSTFTVYVISTAPHRKRNGFTDKRGIDSTW